MDIVEDGWNNHRKIVSEVGDGVLGRKVRNAPRDISENALSLAEKKRGLYQKYFNDRLYENTRNVRKVEKI